MTKSQTFLGKIAARITSISPIERVTDKLLPRAQHTKSVDEAFEDLVEEFDAIESALKSLVESNERFIIHLKETLKSSERAASLLRLLTYQPILVNGQKQDGPSWDRTKSFLAALREIDYSISDPLGFYVSIINKKLTTLQGLSRKINDKVVYRDKALLNYDRVYEKYDQMTIQRTTQNFTPKEVQRYHQLEKKVKSLKREFDSWNSILKLELPTFFILARNFTEPLAIFNFYTHLTVAYQCKLNLLSISPHFDSLKSVCEPDFRKSILEHAQEVKRNLPKLESNFQSQKLTVPITAKVAEEDDADNQGEKKSTSHQRVEYCRALFNYLPDDENDLKFNKGDLIQIIDRKGDWWIGQFKGKKGLFPANYVE